MLLTIRVIQGIVAAIIVSVQNLANAIICIHVWTFKIAHIFARREIKSIRKDPSQIISNLLFEKLNNEAKRISVLA